MARVSTIFVFDLNQKSPKPHPSDEEIQDAKLLYYYPEYREVEERRSHFGLIEGLIGLLGTFTTHKIDFLRTKLFTTTISEWCKDVYLVVCFKNENLPTSEMGEYSHHWKNFMTKVVLENAKHIFELLYGPLYAFLEPSSESTEGLERLRLTFDEILPPFITKAGGDSLHILNSWEASYKSQANAACTLDAQTLIEDLCTRFDAVKGFLFICDKQLIHSSLDMDDMLLLYTYLLKHQGRICKNQEFCLDRTVKVKGDVQILDSEAGTPFGPRIHLKGNHYNLCAICHEDLYLVLLLQVEDVFFTISRIKEYLGGLPHGLGAMLKSLQQPASTHNLKTVSMNSATKTIRSFGYDNIDEKSLKELHIIYNIHQLLDSGAKRINNVHLRTKCGWFSAKVSNDREVYRVLTNESMNLTDVKTTFQDFTDTYLGGIYFI